MDILWHRYHEKIKGVIEGFDRIVFKGTLRPLIYAAGMQSFIGRHGVLNKDYKDWIGSKSTAIISDAENYSKSQCGKGTIYLPTHPQNPEGDRGAQPAKGTGDHARVDWNLVVFGKL